MNTITVYAANSRGNAANCLYPHRMEITDKTSAAKAAFRNATREARCLYKNNTGSIL